ncbi:hypothetical protein [Cognatiyoonia sp. IB215182]|uniref:hypothetical protein n=1 Tax=Cognatiyoonia sp. IB215182 TaxID=3097353 RepID=UPI002A11E6D4|nr:hypothetical protein [Cognatiyoonia sp. IB215182]MDX8350738.1 hypothetical protein [Cognatiyoonia sp. IB215182]
MDRIYRPAVSVTGAASMQDRSLNLALIFAGHKSAVQAVGGIMRATQDGCTVEEGDLTPPVFHWDEDENRRKHVLVSRPQGAKFTLVEFNLFHNIGPVLAHMLPEVCVVTLRSNYPSSKDYFNELAVFEGGERIRRVDRNKLGGSYYEEEGSPLSFEDAARYERPTDERIDRAYLLEIATKLGLDVENALWRRQLEGAVHLTGMDGDGVDKDLERYKERTTRFQSAYERAVELGIGQRETPISEIKLEVLYWERAQACSEYGKRFFQALDRAQPDPAKVLKTYDRWLDATDCPADFTLHHFRPFLNKAGDPDALKELKLQGELWRDANEWRFRISQTVIDDFRNREGDLNELDFAVAKAVRGVRAGKYPKIEIAMRKEMVNVFGRIGYDCDKNMHILSMQEAQAKTPEASIGSLTEPFPLG